MYPAYTDRARPIDLKSLFQDNAYVTNYAIVYIILQLKYN